MSRYINPTPDIDDANGDPIVGAKLYFYETGTTTLKTIYSDSGLSTATTNPQVADASGMYSGDIFLDGIYKVVQKDADDVTIWSKDPVGDTAGGQFTLWTNDSTYNVPEIVLGSDDEYYRSLSDANQGNDPTTTAANWEQLQLGRVYNANITYAAGDSVYGSDGFLYLSRTSSNVGNDPISDTTNWRPGAEIQFTKGADIASATALALGADGNYFDVTGTTAITSIGTVGVGAIAKLHFDGILTLTHHATDLILPGGANITTAAGDEAEFFEYATGDWRCTGYTRADGSALVTTDADAIHDNVAGEIAAITEKTSTVGADLLLIEDSEDSNNKKRVQVANLGAGAWELISSDSLTAVTNIDTIFDEATYIAYRIELEGAIPASDGKQLRGRFLYANGVSVESANNYYPGPLTYFELTGDAYTAVAPGVGSDTGEGLSGTYELTNFGAAYGGGGIRFSSIFENGDGDGEAMISDGYFGSTTQRIYDGFRFYWESGNFEANGTIKVYGLKRS